LLETEKNVVKHKRFSVGVHTKQIRCAQNANEVQHFLGGVMTKLWLLIAAVAGACASVNPNNTTGTDTNTETGIEASSEMQATAIPSGGTDVLGSDTFAAFKGGSSAAVKLEPITVTGRSFTQAWRVTGLQPLPQPYSEQLQATNTVPVQKDDVLLVQFWARAIGGKPAQTEFVFELNKDPYDKSALLGVRLTPNWTLYSVPFKAHRDFPNGTVNTGFRLGYNNQAFELGGVVLKNYAKTRRLESLPFAGFSYVGREANAAWRKAADARIDQLRKADFKIKVVDVNGKAIPNANVKLEMQRHAFKFGTAVDAERLLGSSADSLRYKKTILELFNHVVLENDLKWPNWEDYTRTRALEALKFFKANNITVRGHNLIWPCEDQYCLPRDVPAMFSNPTQLRSRIDSHLVDILGATKGQLLEWDVINEPSANKRLSNVLGEDEMAAQLKRAKQLEPNAKMFLNDYGNLGEGDLDVEFKRIIARMLALGAPLEGIGLQAHFGIQLTPPAELLTRLEDFGKFGLPLAITEFDVNTTNPKLQADYLRDFLTIAFSSQHVNSFLMWGFWEGMHWLPDAALYRKDWTIKPNGQVFKDLLFKRWWTNTSGKSNANGQYTTRGFMGDYRVTVKLGAKTVTKNLKLEQTSGEVVIKLP
jgi:endo-1,4-beta-xylanase